MYFEISQQDSEFSMEEEPLVQNYQQQEQNDEQFSLTHEIDQMINQPSQTSDNSNVIEDEDEQLLKSLHKSSKSASLFNFVNSSLGSGVLTIPYNYKSSGYIGGLILQIIFILLSTLSYNILIKTANHSHRFQYDTVCGRIFPPFVGIITITMQLIFSAGCLISYIVVIRDNFFWWEDDDDLLYKNLLTSGILILLILPLCWLRNLDALKFNSYLVVGCILYIDVVCLYELCDKSINNTLELDKLQVFNWSELPFAIPLFTQAYCAHYNFLNIYRELTHRKLNGNKLVYENQSVISLIYLTIGIFGYISFTDQTQPDILTNLAESGSVLAEIGNVLIIIMMICHYPLPVYSMRLAIEGLLEQSNKKKQSIKLEKYIHTYSRFITSTLLILVCLAIALCLSSIDQILNFTSSIAGCSLGYILPGLFGVRMGQLFHQKNEIIFGSILIVCGCIFMGLGLYAAIYSLI